VNRHRRATLVWTHRVGPGIYHQRFADSLIAREARAGQFVHLLPDPEHLFRRAFSVYATDPDEGTFDILHQVLGAGTRCLARQPVGAVVDTLGPLGNSFSPPPRGLTPVLVGGGLGMAPLRLWALEIVNMCCTGRRKIRPPVVQSVSQPASDRSTNGKTRGLSPLFTSAVARSYALREVMQPILVLGVRSRKLAVTPYQLSRLRLRPHWATDDGSRGFQGTSVGLLAAMIDRGELEPAQIVAYGCGPEAMMIALAHLCATHGIRCEVSLERSMPCGYGVCMGCVVRGRGASGYETYHRVCRDGPIFDATSIVF
jgi:dihydroorotate dehydrogenase electron transfer subunit